MLLMLGLCSGFVGWLAFHSSTATSKEQSKKTKGLASWSAMMTILLAREDNFVSDCAFCSMFVPTVARPFVDIHGISVRDRSTTARVEMEGMFVCKKRRQTQVKPNLEARQDKRFMPKEHVPPEKEKKKFCSPGV